MARGGQAYVVDNSVKNVKSLYLHKFPKMTVVSLPRHIETIS